ncbi:Hypothetical protein A7982_07904 [Minicystis rosea]|nr:Hypothetical protein A7982_07904 [Minicystis rosea]
MPFCPPWEPDGKGHVLDRIEIFPSDSGANIRSMLSFVRG